MLLVATCTAHPTLPASHQHKASPEPDVPGCKPKIPTNPTTPAQELRTCQAAAARLRSTVSWREALTLGNMPTTYSAA